MINFNECLEKYLDPQKPVCREERQIALFLYQKLFDMIGKTKEDMKNIDKSYTRVREACGLSDTDIIKSVYYEVTFMRDFLHQDIKKKSYVFNKKLFEFVCGIFKEDEFSHLIEQGQIESFVFCNNNCKECKYVKNIDSEHIICNKINYGHNSERTKYLDDILAVKTFVRAMMNSKPDLGIIYESVDKKLRLRFLECKDESPESPVNLFDRKIDDKIKKELIHGKSFVMTQTVIQYYIAKFVCEKLLNIGYDEPILIKFDSKSKIQENYKFNKWYFIPKCLYIEEAEADNKIITKIKYSKICYADILPEKSNLSLF